jgi:hypothetical protein
MFESSESRRLISKRVLASGVALLTLGLLVDQYSLPSWGKRKSVGESCQQVVNAKVALSQKQLVQLLAIPEGDKKERIQEVVKEPYCKLEGLQIRAGATAQREAYPLEFDQQTWLVLLYEGDQYTGYRLAGR